jgi:UDP-N-acetylmuramate dehydrogenase
MQENVILAPYTTFAIGGEARFFAVAHTAEDVREAYAFAEEKQLPVFVLGGGSNVLISDEGFIGVVIKLELEGIERKGDMVTAKAGESWDKVVAYAVAENLWGLENLSGIPGTVGGACVQNIGAYGAALSETLASVDVFDTKDNVQKTLAKEQCNFGYRGSIFKQEEGRYVVLSATLELSPTPNPKLTYRDLQARFASTTPTLQDIREAVLLIRKAKFPDLNVEGTAGSFFKNPMLPRVEAEALKQKYPDMPLFDMPETEDIKVPLGWFLDYRHGVLDMRDMRVGGARMFENQFLVVAADRGTSAHDVRELVSLVQKKVFDELKIKIEPEVKIL